MEDREIVSLFWQRDERALDAAAAKYGGYCRTIARNILPDARDAEECLGDTWLHAWNSIPPHRPESLAGFLAKLTRCAALKSCPTASRTAAAWTRRWSCRSWPGGSGASWMRCRRRSGASFSAATGILTALPPSRRSLASARAR